MRLLIDTHVLIWSLVGDQRLREGWRRAMVEAEVVHLSAVSIFEIAVKRSLGKLTVQRDPVDHAARLGFEPLPVTWDHADAVRLLPLHHRDPFDRLLVAQARVEGLTLVTDDRMVRLYDVPVL